mgnify:CR=1 FL=1
MVALAQLARIQTPVLDIAYEHSGPANGLPVILLHGFGTFWWSWRHQLRGLAGARVVAVDLRGYGGSDKPPRGYDGWTLAADTAGPDPARRRLIDQEPGPEHIRIVERRGDAGGASQPVVPHWRPGPVTVSLT